MLWGLWEPCPLEEAWLDAGTWGVMGVSLETYRGWDPWGARNHVPVGRWES